MPGVQSGLQLHEWPKHGSCFRANASASAAAGPDVYFADAAALIHKLNASSLQPLFESHIGASLTRAEIEAAFDSAFGSGASDRLEIECSSGAITQLYIN